MDAYLDMAKDSASMTFQSIGRIAARRTPIPGTQLAFSGLPKSVRTDRDEEV
jgi:hypothetical protein